MTISTTSSSITVAATGASSYSFPFISGGSASNIVVSYTAVGGSLSIVQPNLYTVSLNAPVTGAIWGIGGSVSPVTPANYATGSLTIQRILPLTQSAEISNQGNQYPLVTEQALDIQCMETQQVSARTGTYRGIWSSGVIFGINDYVTDGVNGANTGNYYMCVISNTSNVWATELAAGDWVLALNFTGVTAQVAAAAASADSASATGRTSSGPDSKKVSQRRPKQVPAKVQADSQRVQRQMRKALAKQEVRV